MSKLGVGGGEQSRAGRPAQRALAPKDLSEPCKGQTPPMSQLPEGRKGPAEGAGSQLRGLLSPPGLPARMVRAQPGRQVWAGPALCLPITSC